MTTERVQKILAQSGLSSRRKAEELIREGEVTINGKLAKLGDKADLAKDSIKVKGKLLKKTEAPIYLAFNKPRGVISMLADPDGRPTLAEYLTGVHARVFPIGRLDFNSEGLILLTNDGAMTEKIQKADQVVRVYSVKVRGRPTEEMLTRLAKGAWVGHVRKRLLKPHSVRLSQELASKSLVEVTVMGSGAFDMKGLFELKGFLVEKITRTGIGHLSVKGIPLGEFKVLKDSQLLALLNQPELAARKLEFERQKARPTAVRKPRREPRPQAGEGFKITPVVGSRGAGGPTRSTRDSRNTSKIPTPTTRPRPTRR